MLDQQTEKWLRYVEENVRRSNPPPFAEQWQRFEAISAERPAEMGPQPAWVPGPSEIAPSNIGRLAAERGLEDFEDLHRWSVSHKADFWSAVIDRLEIPFETPPSIIVGSDDPTDPQWLSGATLDITAACFSAEPKAPAIISGREGQDGLQTMTFGQLEILVDRVAHGIKALGLEHGAGVALYMPMTPECVAAYLGVIRAGHPVISIADSFAAEELSRRLRLGGAGAIVTVETFRRGGRNVDLYGKVKEAEAPLAVVIPSREAPGSQLRQGDLSWEDFLGPETPFPSRFQKPVVCTNILFSSGTTGDPKVIPWTQLTPLKCASDGHFHQDIRPGDVVCWPTNIGWMMGPWLIYAALINRASIALFEGLPSGPEFAHFVEQSGVTMLGVVPSLVRAWRDSNACADADWTGIRVFSSTGEPSNREDTLWLMSQTNYRAPMIEYCGGTEIGGGYITGTVVQPCAPATFTTPALGLDFVALSDDGEAITQGCDGEIFLLPPSIGLSETLLNRDHAEVYHQDCPDGPGGEVLRRHGDQLRRLHQGFWRAQGRADDTMNLGGIKISCKEIERVIENHSDVFEAAAVAVQPSGEGAEQLIVFVKLVRTDVRDNLQTDLQAEISNHLNPLFRIEDLVISDELPRTASGKLMRRVLRDRWLGSL